MHFLTEFALARSRLTVLAMLCLIVTGVLLYHGFPKREDPEIAIRQSVVTVEMPGVVPGRMESLIADPVERKIREIPEVDEIKTLIVTGKVSITVSARDSVNKLDPVWQELRDKMEEVARDLPQGANGPYVNTNFGDVSIASIAITAEGFDLPHMEDSAKQLQRILHTVNGVAKVDLYGQQKEIIWLEVNSAKLASQGAQLATLIDDLQSQNVIQPAGRLTAQGNSILLEASGHFSSVEDIAMLLTRLQDNGDLVRLGDIVEVRRGIASPKDKPVYFNGRPAIVVSVQMQSGYDIEALGKALRKTLTEFENSLPIGYEINLAAFQPDMVTEAVNTAMSNVAQTFLVVLLIIMLFLGLRSGLIIASIVPFAIMFALIGMSLLGIDLEQVSIAAIIISLGLLVDNGVVVVEDIQRRIGAGESPHDAALAAGRQFATPLLVSSLTTIFAFMPFFLLEGSDGEFAFSLGAVVAITLIGSWVASMYFLPFISKYLLAPTRARQRDPVQRSNKKRIFNSLVNTYLKALSYSLGKPALVLLICSAAVIFSLLFMGSMSQQMFPLSERNQILIYQDMPKGTDIRATEASVQHVAQWLLDADTNPEVRSHIAYVGFGGPRFYLSLNPPDSAPETAFYLVNIDDFEHALQFADRANRYLIENHPEARFKIKRLSMGSKESGFVEIKITGPDPDRLLALAREVENAFHQVPGISQNENDWGEKNLTVVVDIDQNKARRFGLSTAKVSELLATYFSGTQVSTYEEGERNIPIIIQAREDVRSSIEDLINIVVGDEGNHFALEQIAHLKPRLEYSQMRRLNQQRTITITAKSDNLTAGELLQQVTSELEALDLSGGYSFELGGELADSSETYGKLLRGIPAALFLMLVAIVYQFNSFRKTFMVFATIPLIIIGVPLGLTILAQPMSFFGTLGLISLAGIVINNTIVLIDQIDIDCQNQPLAQGIVAASGTRLQPILLTSATTVLGLVPLYLFGGALWSPLAVVMMSGLAVASILTLFFIPVLYYLLYK
ncbi:MAG: efflux RND transporter permease subunit [Gammaproteobacteria bacterium]|nr:efflux RND transporter permease subunit [Gammaproteobacteria bacterium]